MSDALTEFVTARLDEQEQYARDLVGPHGPRDVSGMVSLSELLLRDAEAKRAILARLDSARAESIEAELLAEEIRGLLASAWSDHPDYTADWPQDTHG